MSAGRSHQMFRNRVIGTEEVPPDSLLANPYNWRVHPLAQQKALEGVLREVGWVQDIVVNQTTGHVIDGHLRVMLAMRNHEELVPVKYVQLSHEEEKLVLATFDSITSLAVADREMLKDLLEQTVPFVEDQEVVDCLSLIADMNRVLEDIPGIAPAQMFSGSDGSTPSSSGSGRKHQVCPNCGFDMRRG